MLFSTITSLISKIEQWFWQHSVCLVKERRNMHNVTLKGQDQIWPQVMLVKWKERGGRSRVEGHVVTQVGHIIYQSTRLYVSNALTSIPRLYRLLIASYWQKRLVTSSDLIWPLEGSATKHFTRSTNKCFLYMIRLGSISVIQLMRETDFIFFAHWMGRSRKWPNLRTQI